MSTPKVTIADIAQDVGVSVATVSKVLNGRFDVADETRARVEESLARHMYTRRRAKEAGNSSRLIELVFHNAQSPWALQIIGGVEGICGPARLGVVLTELGGEHRPEQEWIDDVLARRPMGVLFVLSGPDEDQQRQLNARSIPYVVLDTQGDPQPGVVTVGSNNWSGGLAITRHLIRLGHKRLAVISGPDDVMCSRARVDGFRTAHDEASIRVDPGLIRWGDFTPEAGHRHGLELLAAPDRPTAIFAGSDMQALGVIRAARELGLRVPEDVSVAGYDDLPLSEWFNPPLTTIRQPLEQMAVMAVQLLLGMAAGNEPESDRIELGTKAVIRHSTAPPPDGAVDG